MSLSTKPFLTGIFLLVVATLSAQLTPPRHAVSFAVGFNSFRSISDYNLHTFSPFSTNDFAFQDDQRVTFVQAALGYRYVVPKNTIISLSGTCHYVGGSATVFSRRDFRLTGMNDLQYREARQPKQFQHTWVTALLNMNLTKPNPKSRGVYLGLGVAYGVFKEEYLSGISWNSSSKTIYSTHTTFEQGDKWGIPLTFEFNKQLSPRVAVGLGYSTIFWISEANYSGWQFVFRQGIGKIADKD